MLQRLVGPQTAAAMVLAGRRLDAAAAYAAGLVLDVTADDLAARIAQAPRDLVLSTKRSLHEETDLTAEEAMDQEEERQLWSLQLPSTAQGLRTLGRR